ncbi:T9SS sorting signal type C domain-containing protein [Flavobacterium terrisoli]|uniref:T9SS sorting signal type C domain-containing protein n=1 Tax=Flavobacterium terrisoli TaxID=3242195 RepID=UPI0025435ECF|nr:T9SS sorting signal type C domain-containing protein [Flavobacterium buctense]
MKRRLLFTALLLVFFSTVNLNAQVATVFNDNFTTSAGTTFTTANGPIGTSPTWNLSRSGVDYGAGINSGLLILGNDASSAGNLAGWVMGYTNTAGFLTPYSTTLNSNPGDVTWTFNMRQPQANPSGFASGNYGVAFILAGTSGTTNSSGTGYAVTLGNSGKTDPLRLVSYSSGLQTSTTIVTSNTSGLTDFGNPYISVKVIYTPSTNTWKLYVRNDGTAFLDPNSGSLTLQGSPTVNSTYTGTALPIMGGFWNASTKFNQSALFDNVKITVVVPSITSLAPPSKVAGTGAFTLTVNGNNFVNGTSVVKWNGSNRSTTFVSTTQLTASILATDITTAGTAAITVANGTAVSNAQNFTIDPAGVPNIALSTSGLNTMTTITGTASSAQTYTVSGTNLTANIGITAPANFEISTNGTTYFASLSLTQTAGSVSNTTIYARVKASAPSGIYAATIDHTTTGGATKTISVAATVIAAKPTIQATAVNFTSVTSTTFTVNWTNGNGANHIVLIKNGSAVNSNPVDGVTYTAVNSFGAGSEIGTGNYVIYAGTANTINLSGLQPNTTYHVAVYDYNGSAGTESYLTTTPATGNRTTLNAPVGWQIYTANTANTINFDTTIDGVNEGIYQAAGLSPSLTNGELNSNAWAMTGFTDGAIAFGGTSTDGQDYDRGTATGSVSVGGVYAFETTTNNFSLGIKPATGDFAPGTVTLRFQNQTGAAVTSISIGYKVYIYNDQAASSSFNFSHSADNSTYTGVAGLNVVSPAAADASPGWKAYYRVVTLTGLSIANNNYYYFRWSGATVSGSVDFDQFGLDDIVMVANPSTNYASFNGNAENFVVLGNATLSGSTTVAGDITFNGGKVDLNGNTLTLNGIVTNTTTGGLKGSASSNLIISGAVSPSLSFDQTTLGTTNLLNNLSINTTASNTVTVLNPVVVNGTLTTVLGQTLNLGTNALTGTLSGIANNGTISTQNTSSLPIPSGKTWSGSGTINYNATSAAQTIVVGTYQNLTSSSTGGATAAGNLTVNDVLHLPTANPSSTLGSLSMATFTLTMGANATNTGIGDVTGIVTRNSIVANTLYTFGNTYTSIIFPNIGTLPTSMSLKIAIGAAPSWRTGAINRTYDFIQTGGSGTKAVIKAHYLDTELNGNAEIKLVDWAYIVASSTVLEQGRSNYNTTENWVELTNVNVGLYFTGTFNQVLLTLDESAAGSLTWNGSVSDSWTTAANWTPNATPSDFTIVYIPDAATTPNDPTLNPAVLLGSLNIDAGGILNAPANSQFTVNNGAGAWINNGTYNPGTGTSAVIFTNADATMAGSTNFNNITINSGASLRPLTDNIMQIAGTFTRNGSFTSGSIENTVIYTGTNQTIVTPNGGLQAYHNLIINGTGAVFPTSLNIAGNLTLNQSVDFTGKTIAMLGSEPQIIAGTSTPTFNNLTVNNLDSGVSLGTNTFVNGTLTLTAGNLDLGNYNLTLAAAVSGAFSATNMIVASGSGEVRRTFTNTGSYTFPIGDNTVTAEYSPITVSVTAGSFSSAYVGVSVVDAIHPNNSSTTNHLTRYWKVSESGITGAMANISATYSASDITGMEGDISSAQLNGTFNQASNPWIKYTALSGNTLLATGATLTSGQTSAFTGIKGGNFTAMISGYGTFCLNDVVTLTATPTGGDAPYTYLWSSGLGTDETAVPSTTASGTLNYVITIKDNNGITATDNANVEVSPASVGGTTSGGSSICAGSTSGLLTLSGYTGNVIRWESSVSPFSVWTPISNTSASYTSGALTQTTRFRAVVQSGLCTEANSGDTSVTISSTTWSGGIWTNGAPNATTSAVISDAYTSGGNNINACSLTINNNAVVQISSGDTVTLSGALVTETGSVVTFNNNANLIQGGTTNANSGSIFVRRNSSALMRLDYTLWSSPVLGSQTLLDFSPETLTNRFYTYNTSTNFYDAITPSVTFVTAKGYLIRMPNTHPTTPTVWNGQFSGVPNNGNYNYTMTDIASGQRFNLVGNPYPSPINANAFVSANSANITGALYFWRKTNNVLSPSYCTWTTIGFTSNGEAQVFDPNGVIQTGQGFFVEASGNGTALNFNNSMRVDNHANQFFRNSNTTSDIAEQSKIWLNAFNSTGSFSQTLLGYVANATLGYDVSIDGKYINDGDIALTSIIGAEKYAIQGRALPFDINDVVPMNFKATNAGNYTIAIDHVDGLFLGEQSIYLRDNTTGIIQDLKTGSYTFTSAAGTFDSRFDILYQIPLSVGLPTFNENQVVVYENPAEELVVNTGSIVMDSVKVFDIRGRLLQEQKNVNAAQTVINVSLANQVLLVQITSQDGISVTKKVIR